jgi:hypothetical protein
MVLFLYRFTKIWEQKLKNGNKKLPPGTKIQKKLGTKFTKFQEQKLQKSGNKSYKNFKNMRTKIQEQKFQQSRNKS